MKKEIKLSKEMKIILAIGGVLIVAVLGFMLTSKPKSSASATSAVTPPPTPTTPSVSALAPTASSDKKAAALDLLPGLPAPVRAALTAHGVVVAVVYGAGDKDAVTAAREGAHTAHAGFAALNVAKEGVAQAVELFAPATSDPTVLVVRRPGTVTTVLPGYSDSDTVAQAAAQPDTPPATATTPGTTTPAPATAPAATPAP